MYIFVRTDLPIEHQIIQTNHATLHMAGLRAEHGTPNIVLIGIPSLTSLLRVERKLEANGIPHYSWIEPDHDFGFTAITTAPVRGEQRKLFSNYRVYAPVAQHAERRTLNSQVVGANPTGCAKFAPECTDTSSVRV